MPYFIKSSLESQWLWRISRCCMALLFFSSGLSKVLDVNAGFQEMQAAGLEPAWLFNYASALILLAGAYSILFDRHLWLGAALLSIFLALTIVIVHTFWNMSGAQANISLYFALEHISVIGGLIGIAIASHFRQQLQDVGVIA
ncbi:DoxX family protein [Acinetobacter colistiniresistens]|uniref:DoxX family protein n=1 Tax=Acinetobacter colistiniresistens TaxID=280145 RepID=S3T673_9GAMM|nr:DoxX family protein [Acinetobacter colistiniresistens]EPG37031.1 hypothetical protein F907_02296 [Acinetobacter colistiniresistens]TVT79900.1 DoxX family protein [Acinetobacter colistiniresistens]